MIVDFYRDGCKFGSAQVDSVDMKTKTIIFADKLPFLVLPSDGIVYDQNELEALLRTIRLNRRPL
jgi:hypothetical protein